jgi:serine/threonine protein kinase
MLISNKYKIIKEIGSGNYGNIYLGEHIYFKKHVAIKIVIGKNNILLKNEAKIYNLLQNTIGVPNMLMYGIENNINFLILERMDNVLERINTSRFTGIAIKIIEIIEAIHSKGVIHRDIKPDNFMFKNNKLFLIDYGLATTFCNFEKKHNNKKVTNNIIGSLNYISLNVHEKMMPSRRDDLESIVYIFIYLLNKNLPWKDYDKKDIILCKKKLIDDNTFDVNIINILKYIRGLEHFDNPDYLFLYKQLKDYGSNCIND